MKTNTPTADGSRFWAKLKNLAEALDYSRADYTFDRLASLRNELDEVESRVRKLEAGAGERARVPGDEAA